MLASHKSFDAYLTVGWNVVLASRLGAELEDAVCVKGYKGDPERKIGLVARFVSGGRRFEDLVKDIKREFGGVGDLYSGKGKDDGQNNEFVEREVKVLAIMNAFHAEEVERVIDVAREKGWVSTSSAGEDGERGVDVNGREIMYLTGAAREYGLETIKKYDMPAFCVGHRACEEWGIRFLAEETRKRWPVLDAIVVLEEEEPRPKKETKKLDSELDEGQTANVGADDAQISKDSA